MKATIAKVLSLLYIVLTLQACGPGEPGLYKGAKIKDDVKQTIHQLNDELFAAIKQKKVYEAENLMSKGLLESNTYRGTIETVGLHSQSGNFTTLDEFYMVNYSVSDSHKLNTTASDGNKYSFHATAITEEMYVVFLVPQDKGDKYIITLQYCKYDYGWKLNVLDINFYTRIGKTAPQLYELAKQQYKKGCLLDTYNTMQLVDKTMQPNEFWKYPQDDDMYAFKAQVGDELGKIYHFPLTINMVPTLPKIFNLDIQTTAEGVFPQIYYQSKIDIKNEVAVQAEVDKVAQVIGKLFPGIDKDKKHIYFSVFNELPTRKKNYPSYEAIVDLPR